MYLQEFIKNGVHLPIISFFIYLLCDNIYLPVFFFFKAYSINYYYHYNYLFPKPNMYKWRHMFRLTDTGHIAAFLFYFNKKLLPIAYNVHFVIDVGYYFSKFVLGMKDTDVYDGNSKSFKIINKMHESTNHCITYLLIIYYMVTNKEKEYEFDNYSLIYTFIWIYSWLLFIYIPWVLLTNDYIYSVLEPSKPLYIRIGIILFMNVLAYISNNTGKFISSI